MGLDLLEISYHYCGVMDAFRGLKFINEIFQFENSK